MSPDQEDSSMESISPEEASRIIFSSNSVHDIFSVRQQLAVRDSDFSSLGSLSTQEPRSLQTNLESNNAPIQRHLQLKEPPLYDVDQKIFNSIDYQPNTEFSEYESLDRLRLPDHSSFNGSTTQETIQNPQIGLPNNSEIDSVSIQESQSVEENLVLGNKIVPLPLEDKESELELKLKEKEDQLKEKQQQLDKLYETISMQDQKIGDLTRQHKAHCVSLQEDLKCAEQKNSNRQRVNDALTRKNYQLMEDKDLLSSRFKDLEDENTKLLVASGQSRKQINYASAAFVLSGALAVGASLTMFHLAVCISLAVAALTFFATGCYCLYKANTALSNVEVKNGVDPTAVEV